jgi:hypothetical protein
MAKIPAQFGGARVGEAGEDRVRFDAHVLGSIAVARLLQGFGQVAECDGQSPRIGWPTAVFGGALVKFDCLGQAAERAQSAADAIESDRLTQPVTGGALAGEVAAVVIEGAGVAALGILKISLLEEHGVSEYAVVQAGHDGVGLRQVGAGSGVASCFSVDP